MTTGRRPTGGKRVAVDRRTRAWSDLGRREKRAVVALSGVQVGLQVAALRDLHRRSAREVRGSRGWWAAASFVNFVGPIAYFAVGRRRPGDPSTA